jgi:hypothetical protein
MLVGIFYHLTAGATISQPCAFGSRLKVTIISWQQSKTRALRASFFVLIVVYASVA